MMTSQFCNVAAGEPGRRPRRGRRDKRGVVALEFAILAIPFFTWMLFIFELSYDLFLQEALDSALHEAVRQVQTGVAQNQVSGAAFVSTYMCPAANGRLECSRIFVNVTPVAPGTDYHLVKIGGITPIGVVPMNGTTLDLSNFNDGVGSADFCNGAPRQPLLVSAIYIGPSFLGGLLPGVLSAFYNGVRVHPALATTGIVIEPYVAVPGNGGSAPAPSCGTST